MSDKKHTYCSLHTHSSFSIRDSCNRIDDLVTRAKDVGMKAISINDHGNVFGLIKMYKACQENNIKFVPGIEAYFTHDHSEKERSSRHITILVENNIGLENLYKLVTRSNLPGTRGGGFYFRPRIDWSDLKEFHEGLIILSGCMNSPINFEFWKNEDYETGKKYAKEMIKIVGKDNFFVELQNVNEKNNIYIPEQEIILEYSRRLASDLGVSACASNDCHITNKNDAFAHEVLKAIDARMTLDSPVVNRSKGITRGRLVFSGFDYYVRSDKEMRQKFTDEEVETSSIIADRCNVTFPLGENHMPSFRGMSDDDCYDFLVQECRKGWKKLDINGKKNKQVYLDRLKHELKEVKDARLHHYFMIVWDVCRFCCDNQIALGFGRGSCSGSLALYLLGITQRSDPIKYGLIWERFWNHGRKGSMPDIDLDIQPDRRDEVINYLREQFGDDKVMPMMTIGTMAAKEAIISCGKVIGLNSDYLHSITKLFPHKYKDLNDVIDMVPEIKDASKGIDANIKQWRKEWKKATPGQQKELERQAKDRKDKLIKTFQVAKRLEGTVSNRGTHACAILLSDESIEGKIPTCWDAKSRSVLTGFDMYDLDDLGYMKLDCLGLKTLGVINSIDTDFHNTVGEFDDPEVYKALSRGKNKGIFQLESQLGVKWTKRQKPRTILDIADLITIIRPAALEPGLSEQYIKNRDNTKQKPQYLHPDLEPILASSEGCMIYQEQALEIAREMAGFTYQRADDLRKVLGKKLEEKLPEFEAEFKDGVMDKYDDQSLADELWEWLKHGAGYGFNKCISGKTVIYRGSQNNKNLKTTIEHLYKTYNDLEYAKDKGVIPLRKKLRRYGYGEILALDADSRIRPRPIRDIVLTGEKETFKITLDNGKTVAASKDHKFFTTDGFVSMEDMTVGLTSIVCDSGFEKKNQNGAYNFSDKDNTYKSRPYASPKCGFSTGSDNPAYTNDQYGAFLAIKESLKDIKYCQNCSKANVRLEHHHVDKDRFNNLPENIIKLCASCHKKEEYPIGRNKKWHNGHATENSTVVNIESCGVEMTYDIEMDTSEHNFIANGLVSSNSHALTYGMMGYATAYYKMYFPNEFFCAMLQFSEYKQNTQEEIAELFYDAKHHDVVVNGPCARHANHNFEIIDGEIYYGLTKIKHVGKTTISSLKKVRLDSWSDVMANRKKLKKNVVEALIWSGALDYLEIPRGEMAGQMTFLEDLTDREIEIFDTGLIGAAPAEFKGGKIVSLSTKGESLTFRDTVDSFYRFMTDENPTLKVISARRAQKVTDHLAAFLAAEVGEEDVAKLAAKETHYLGIPLTYCEVDTYNDNRQTHNLIEIDKEINGKGVATIGVVSRMNTRLDRNRNRMCFISLQDRTSMVESVMFSDAYKKYGQQIEVGDVIYAEGKKNGTGSFQIEKVEVL
ncbi:DNA polymerase III subunit alpha [Candidatus Pacearchaeota archaeon]|nr:DNA polymerase III subunit alpha [Candidatus Pacearchaeota archaeon]